MRGGPAALARLTADRWPRRPQGVPQWRHHAPRRAPDPSVRSSADAAGGGVSAHADRRGRGVTAAAYSGAVDVTSGSPSIPDRDPYKADREHVPDRDHTTNADQHVPDRDYHQGSVVMRRSKVPGSTSDQRLLDSRGSADWVHTDPWRVMRIQSEFVTGFGAL